MLVSAIIVTLLLMTTAASMNNIQEGQYEPMQQGYHINAIQQLGQKMDLGEKSARKKFKNALNFINSYSLDFKYWKVNRCYNITLSNSNTELRMKCVGNGSIFHDSFEDGEYKDPAWIKETGTGKATVKTTYGPATGNKALVLSQNQTGTSLKIRWDEKTGIWNRAWKASGVFHTDKLNSSTSQRQYIKLYYDHNSGTSGLVLDLGFSDSSGQTPVTIDPPGASPSSGNINWQEDTWYSWELTHDGSGKYTAWVWPEKNSRPSIPTVQVTGNPLGNEKRSGMIELSGSGGQAFQVRHDYVKLQAR